MLIDAVLAEYRSVRNEIEQLNGQVFAVLSSSLALNVAVLGWLFGKERSSEFFALPTVGILFLLCGTIILLNRNRLAHRLAFFQKYFIESRIPDICWGRVYFEYRECYPTAGFFTRCAERLAESGAYVLIAAGTVNIGILVILGLRPLFGSAPTDIDWVQVVNFAIALLLLSLQICFKRMMTEYRPIDATMQRLAKQSGLTLIRLPVSRGKSNPERKGKRFSF
jgi:hypothetical protein